MRRTYKQKEMKKVSNEYYTTMFAFIPILTKIEYIRCIYDTERIVLKDVYFVFPTPLGIMVTKDVDETYPEYHHILWENIEDIGIDYAKKDEK